MLPKSVAIYRYADATMPTVHGPLRAIVYRHKDDARQAGPGASPSIVPAQDEHLAIVTGELSGAEDVLCRVHSECWTGETLGSLKCDCRQQLDAALAAITAAGRGVVIYLRQEGRGIGLGNKLRAYALQNVGVDTVEANEALGFAPDLRSYDLAAAMLADLGVRSVALLTNNPDKLRELAAAGIQVTKRVPHWVSENQHNQDYLAVKREKLGHAR
ncbi:MAG: GTP cyclohydrolase II [Myxococcales bacterium]|nr:GTP cyclohydrolase II [Myxococcales bacterium]